MASPCSQRESADSEWASERATRVTLVMIESRVDAGRGRRSVGMDSAVQACVYR